MSSRGFLLLHGLEHRKSPGHWLFQLARTLEDQGETVRYPQLPKPDAPLLAEWLASLDAELAAFGGGEGVVVCCHSMGCMLWLHHAERGIVEQRVERVLLVAPPSPSILWRTPPALTPMGLRASARRGVRLVHSDSDPYCPEGAEVLFGVPFELERDAIEAGGHLSEPDGYGPWPALAAWCRDPLVPITGNRSASPGALGRPSAPA